MRETREKVKAIQEFIKSTRGDAPKTEEYKKFVAMNIDQRMEYIAKFKKHDAKEIVGPRGEEHFKQHSANLLTFLTDFLH